MPLASKVLIFAARSNPLATCRTARDIAQDVGYGFLIGTLFQGVAVSHITQHVIGFVIRQILLAAELVSQTARRKTAVGEDHNAADLSTVEAGCNAIGGAV
ncbi:hypothetical protein B5807_07060 [Epicoccum nigrum]|jgi:hypothetical protein|uniref:Uncharacterized protein n=1 Tax=Epicoccum nigrum TaxID=105696 RepID=A0A1Y2M0Y9_EPING|nr:hypothetical protein B5807_07060 [Epicoccum nigrum]